MSQAYRDPDEHRRAGAAANGWLVVVLVILMAVLLFRTVNETLSSRRDYTPRVVAARGDLAGDEQARIAVFENSASSVVFVKTKGWQPNRFNTASLEEQELSSGTGFVWDEQGHIITNFHVVKESVLRADTQLEVQFIDGSVHDAEFIGAVYQHDIAVLKVTVPPALLIPIALGTSDDLRVGQTVLAIGNPFGFDRTLSEGVIGGLNRTVPTSDKDNEFLDGLIQTDAAINPGNSGGPLLDSAGRLIGVNTAIVSTSGASAGLGFAVPVRDVMKSVADVLRQAKGSQSGALGIVILAEKSAKGLGVPDEIFARGPILHHVYPYSAAAEAGLQGTQLLRIY